MPLDSFDRRQTSRSLSEWRQNLLINVLLMTEKFSDRHCLSFEQFIDSQFFSDQLKRHSVTRRENYRDFLLLSLALYVVHRLSICSSCLCRFFLRFNETKPRTKGRIIFSSRPNLEEKQLFFLLVDRSSIIRSNLFEKEKYRKCLKKK